MDPNQQMLICPECSKSNPPDARFCNNCAKPLHDLEQYSTNTLAQQGTNQEHWAYRAGTQYAAVSSKGFFKRIQGLIPVALIFGGILFLIILGYMFDTKPAGMRETVDSFISNLKDTAGLPNNSSPTKSKSSSNSEKQARMMKISKQMLGDEYPFTVSEGILSCNDEPNAVLFVVGSTIYAVNGTAKSLKNSSGEKRYKPIDEIWADNPKIKGTKVDVGKVIELGLELCQK